MSKLKGKQGVSEKLGSCQSSFDNMCRKIITGSAIDFNHIFSNVNCDCYSVENASCKNQSIAKDFNSHV